MAEKKELQQSTAKNKKKMEEWKKKKTTMMKEGDGMGGKRERIKVRVLDWRKKNIFHK